MCNELNTMQKQIYFSNNGKAVLIDKFNERQKNSARDQEIKAKIKKDKTLEVVDIQEIKFEVNYKDKYAFCNQKVLQTQKSLKKKKKEKLRREREDATKE